MKRKYALVQHLPAGDYWTSLNSDVAVAPPPVGPPELKDLPTGYAELVAVLPIPSTTLLSPSSVPNLGSYNPSKQSSSKKPLPSQRRLTTGSFLDYGVWASFAPSFDQSGELVGRRELGEVLSGWEQRKRDWEEWRREYVDGTGHVEEITDVDMGHARKEVSRVAESQHMDAIDIDAELNELLPPEQVETIKAALGSLELENAVQELLERNSRALARLEELQFLRFTRDNGGSSVVEEDSEEWETGSSSLKLVVHVVLDAYIQRMVLWSHSPS